MEVPSLGSRPTAQRACIKGDTGSLEIDRQPPELLRKLADLPRSDLEQVIGRRPSTAVTRSWVARTPPRAGATEAKNVSITILGRSHTPGKSKTTERYSPPKSADLTLLVGGTTICEKQEQPSNTGAFGASI